MPVRPFIPNRRECEAIWDKYDMLEGVRAHSLAVARVAACMADRAEEKGFSVDRASWEAAALLHDIAKTYTIRCGGSHAQLGAMWAMQETRAPWIAQAVLFHVSVPWPEKVLEANPLLLPFVISYADKRVKFDQVVSLEERFRDLFARYGLNEAKMSSIDRNRDFGFKMERELERVLGPLQNIR
ncbi:MAG: HDIG domain-containing protein [Mailhella sp.]|nr:HDIG domain-containing protein [Mailhella sp.]